MLYFNSTNGLKLINGKLIAKLVTGFIFTGANLYMN